MGERSTLLQPWRPETVDAPQRPSRSRRPRRSRQGSGGRRLDEGAARTPEPQRELALPTADLRLCLQKVWRVGPRTRGRGAMRGGRLGGRAPQPGAAGRARVWWRADGTTSLPSRPSWTSSRTFRSWSGQVFQRSRLCLTSCPRLTPLLAGPQCGTGGPALSAHSSWGLTSDQAHRALPV